MTEASNIHLPGLLRGCLGLSQRFSLSFLAVFLDLTLLPFLVIGEVLFVFFEFGDSFL